MPPPSALSKMALWLRFGLLSDNYRSIKADLYNIEETMRDHVDKNRHAFSLQSNLGFYSILFYPITFEGRRGTTDEFATIPFHLDLFSAALVELAKTIPVHSLILSSHLVSSLPLFLFPFTVPL